jgi:hypothetical protein
VIDNAGQKLAYVYFEDEATVYYRGMAMGVGLKRKAKLWRENIAAG